jgi:SAM-dependent methyltransferase
MTKSFFDTHDSVDTSTCWYQQSVVDEMNSFYDIHRNNPETCWHFENFAILLRKALQSICDNRNLSFAQKPLILDLGCGGGQLRDFCKHEEDTIYCGADLPHIIDGCLLRNYRDMHDDKSGSGPQVFKIDLTKDDLSFISKFDIVVLNGVIDIMQYPVEVLMNVMEAGPKHLIIHRQEITEDPLISSVVKRNGSYGGETFHAVIGRKHFNLIVQTMGFEIVHEEKLKFANWENGGCSFLLRKKQVAE